MIKFCLIIPNPLTLHEAVQLKSLTYTASSPSTFKYFRLWLHRHSTPDLAAVQSGQPGPWVASSWATWAFASFTRAARLHHDALGRRMQRPPGPGGHGHGRREPLRGRQGPRLSGQVQQPNVKKERFAKIQILRQTAGKRFKSLLNTKETFFR